MSNTMLIDAAPILEALNKRYRELYGICRNAVMHIRVEARLSQLEEDMELIQKAPIIDDGQVIRCKDCKRCAGPMPSRKDRHVCVYWNHLTDPSGYCHMGEKRDDTKSD